MILRVLILCLFSVMAIYSQAPAIEPGVPHTLAKWRAVRYSNVSYSLDLQLVPKSPTLTGKFAVNLQLSEAGPIVLDWRKIRGHENLSTISDVMLNGKAAEFEEVNEHIVVKNAAKGENTVTLRFTSPILASGSAITRYLDKQDQGEYIYSLFVPSDASTAFPVFDQPDLKARFKLSVYAPSEWRVVTNTELEAVRMVGVTKGPDDKPYIKTFFKPTMPISTYVFAFAAGDFMQMSESSTIEEKALSTKIYVRRSQADKFKPHGAEVFRLNREGVKYLEEYFDYKFPFPKYDLILIPEFPFGGMEHAGATFLREEAIIFPQEPTANNYISRANLIFHEAAHQWFGDTVTMRWFDDLWLKEGFAEFMAYKTLEKVMPEYNAWKVFYERNKQAAYLTDSTKGTTPIYQEIANLSAAKSAYGNIVYRKAPSFLRQAEFYIGEAKFQAAVRAFLKKYEYANAGFEDLIKEFEAATGENLAQWADDWIKTTGVPVISVGPKKTDGDTARWSLSASGSVPEDAKAHREMRLKVMTYIRAAERKAGMMLESDEKRENENVRLGRIDVPVFYTEQKMRGSVPPAAFFPNYQDYGYVIVQLDPVSRKYFLQNIQNEKDVFLRTLLWGTLWDNVRLGNLDPKEYVELVIKHLDVEKDESTIATLLGRVSTASAYYLSDKQRDEIAPRLEGLLLERMKSAQTMGQKLTFYRAYLGTASTPEARKTLKDILASAAAPEPVKEGITKAAPASPALFGLPPLKTKDKFDIVTRLIVLGDPGSAALLAELEKTETSDEAKRYAYAAKAGIPTAENKAKFVQDFTGNKEISESWIEAGFGTFNSVRHAELTLPYLEKALAELPNLKRNRKIFFVNGWLGAFIGGQTSEQALATVNKFLVDNPNLDRDLRLKILENVDGLERAVKIRKQFGK